MDGPARRASRLALGAGTLRTTSGQSLNGAFRAVRNEAEFRRRLTGMAAVALLMLDAELGARKRGERASWTPRVSDARIEVN